MKAALLLLLSVCRTSAHATVTVSPSRSQFYEFEKVSVSCEQVSSGEWTVWRYNTNGLEPVLSQCGSGWGTKNSTSCDMEPITVTDTGVYWCESKHRDSSNVINITVTVGPVILQSPVHPVMEGNNVTLTCKNKMITNLPAAFYKDGSLIRTEPAGHMTIRNFSKSDEGAYKCRFSTDEPPPSWLLMKEDSFKASLTSSPTFSQLFEYKNLSLSCGDNSRLHGWKVFRSVTSDNKVSVCGNKWGSPTALGCTIQTTTTLDSAVYWCESPMRQRSNSVNINVHGGPVILQSPVLPVMEGNNVTLTCKTTETTSNLTAGFYKDGSLIRTEPAGHMTFHHVSKSDEGLYRCSINRKESPCSWLYVRGSHGPAGSTTDSTLCDLRVIRYLVLCFPYVVCTVIWCSSCCRKASGRNPPVSMTTSPPSQDDEGLDQQHDDVMADVTTEHHF